MKTSTPTAIGYLLIAALVLPMASFAREVRTADSARAVPSAGDKRSSTDWLIEVPTGTVDGTYNTEAQRAQLVAKGDKNRIIGVGDDTRAMR